MQRKSKVHIILIGLPLLAAALSSCTTVRTNAFLIKDLSPEEKAALLFDKTVEEYAEQIQKKQDYAKIKPVRTAFTDVLALNPTFVEADKYIAELDHLKETKIKEYKAVIAKLGPLEKKSDSQTYEYLLAIQRLKTIEPGDKDASRLMKDTAEIRDADIALRIERLGDLHASIMEEKNQQVLLKNLRTAKASIAQIETLKPGVREVRVIEDDLDMKMNDFVAQDIAIAETKLAAKRYSEAETAILQAEKSLKSFTNEPSARVADLKYAIYYNWAVQYYETKKWQSAGQRTNQAIAIRKTSEAVSLKNKINKAAAQRDYDAEIGDILASIDSMLKQDDPAGAATAIQANLPRMQRQSSKNSLNDKLAEAQNLAAKIYKEGVDLYTDEDYAGSIRKFQIVVAFSKDYEQAQSYLSKAQAKTKALSGAQ